MINLKEIEKIKSAVPPLRMLSKTDQEKAIIFIPAISKQYGIISEMNEIDLKGMIKFVSTQFQNMNAKEMLYAFELYGSGKLTIPKEKEHFGKLNLTFLGALFSAYEKLKQQAKTELIPQTDPTKLLKGKDEEQIWKEWYINLLQWVKENKSLPDKYPYEYCFRYLKAAKRITLTDDEFKKHQLSVISQINLDTDERPSPELRRNYRMQFVNGSIAFINRCRHDYFIKWWHENYSAEWLQVEIEKVK